MSLTGPGISNLLDCFGWSPVVLHASLVSPLYLSNSGTDASVVEKYSRNSEKMNFNVLYCFRKPTEDENLQSWIITKDKGIEIFLLTKSVC